MDAEIDMQPVPGIADGRIRYREDIVNAWRRRPSLYRHAGRTQLRQADRPRGRLAPRRSVIPPPIQSLAL